MKSFAMCFRVNCINDTRNAMHVENVVVRYTCPKGTVWQEGNSTYRTNGTYNEGKFSYLTRPIDKRVIFRDCLL